MSFDFDRLIGQVAAAAAAEQPKAEAPKGSVPPDGSPRKPEASAGEKAAPRTGFAGADRMTLKLAHLLMAAVERQAADMGVNAVVAVADAGGNTLSVDCMDDAFLASYDIAVNKAYTSVALKMPTADLAQLAAPGGSLYGIQNTNGGRIVIFGGGQPLRSKGVIIGGVGVSGGTAAEDTFLGEFARRVFEELVKA